MADFTDPWTYFWPSNDQTLALALQASLSGSPPPHPDPFSDSDSGSRMIPEPSAAVPGPSRKIGKRRSRASKKSPITFITADAANFRAMVQQVTGVRFGDEVGPVEEVRPVAPVQHSCLPTLDTSAYLLPAVQEGFVSDRGTGSGFSGPGSVSGFQPCYPTLESWSVV